MNIDVQHLIERAIYIAGAVIVLWQFFYYLRDKGKIRVDAEIQKLKIEENVKLAELKETSLGAEKVKEILKELTVIRSLITDMEKHDKKQDDKIEELEKHYDNLIDKVWDFLKK